MLKIPGISLKKWMALTRKNTGKNVKKRFESLEKKCATKLVDRTPMMNVLSGYSDVRDILMVMYDAKVKNLCQGWQTDWSCSFFETFAPAVNWNTVNLLLIISIVFDLETKQVGYTYAFWHTEIYEKDFDNGICFSMTHLSQIKKLM